MKIQMYLDDVLCEGEISKINWFCGFLSIALHPTNRGKWQYFKVTNIKGNPKYKSWNYIHIRAEKFLKFH